MRVSYNRAFRAPSMVNNNLDVTIGTPLPLGLINPAFGSQVFLVPTHAVGNPDLVEESIDAFEVSYTGNIRDRASVSAAWYYTKFEEQIFFTTTGVWLTPPPGLSRAWGRFRPPSIWAGAPQPTASSFRPTSATAISGEVKSQGLELGIDGSLDERRQRVRELLVPGRSGTGFSWAHGRAGAAGNQHSRANTCSTPACRASAGRVVRRSCRSATRPRRSGRTSSTPGSTARRSGYTMVNLTAGVKFGGGRYSAALKIVNLGNEEVQQHIFGDVLKRQIMVELKMSLTEM